MKPFLILVLLMISLSAFAQKNAPVAGQASILADLLKKDYHSIDPDLAGDQLIADRAQVISIFRSFMTNTVSHTSKISQTLLAKAKTKAEDYNTKKKVAATAGITTVSTATDGVAKVVNDANEKRITDQEGARKAYYSARYQADSLLLKQLKSDYSEEHNIFISSVIDAFITKYAALDAGGADLLATGGIDGSVNKALPVFGAFGNTTEIIDGLSKFLAKRIKEELTTFAIQNIQEWLNNNSKKTPLEELLVLFPATANYISKFDADRVTSFPNEIKQYIENDLNNLMDNGYLLQNTTFFQNAIRRNPNIQLAFEAFHLVPQLTKMKNPADFITLLSNSKVIPILQATNIGTNLPKNDTSYNIGAGIAFLELMSNSLTITTNGQPQYTTVDFWSNYGKEIPFLELYVGFLRQQNLKYYNVQFYATHVAYTLESWLLPVVNQTDATYLDRINQLQPVIIDICKSAESIYDQAQNLKKLNNSGTKIGADTIFSFNKSVIAFTRDLSTDADQIIHIFQPAATTPTAIAVGMKPYITVADTANEALKNIFGKKYAAGIIELLQMGFSLLPDSQQVQVNNYVNIYNLTKTTPAQLAAWKTVCDLVQHPVTATPAQITAAGLIVTELGGVEAGYQATPGSKSSITKLIHNAKNNLAALNGTASDVDFLKKLADAWKNKQFREQVIAHYINPVLTADITKLYQQMSQPLNDGSGSQSPAMSSSNLSLIKDNIEKYISLAFDDKIQQLPGVDAQLIGAEANLAVTITSFVAKQGGVFGYKLDTRIVSLIHFINDMALSKNSDDVEAAIEALALPAGSYSIKQKSYYTLSVNAFPGIIGGWELTNGYKKAGSIGFTAPVGLNVTWGRIYRNWTLGAFVPLIDVGAVTRLRLDKDKDTQTLPDLTWKNIFSPGFYLTLGIGKTPFSINLGAQYGPEVQSLSGGNPHPSWRIGGGLTIDIPFFNIYNKPVSY